MAATLKVITGKIGEGGHTQGPELLRIQQLLARCLMLRPADISGTWSDATKEAILDFKEFFKVPEKQRTASFEPTDPYDLLFKLCKSAGVLFEVPAVKRGAAALSEFFAKSVAQEIPYGWAGRGVADRIVYGLYGYPNHLIFTNLKSTFDLNGNPLAMNCTSFTNLVISIWRTGNAHGHPYDSSQRAGGFVPVALRYGLTFIHNPGAPSTSAPMYSFDSPFGAKARPKPVGVTLPSPLSLDNYETYFYSAEEALAVVVPDKLYYLQWCHLHDTKNKNNAVTPSGFGHHDTVLYGGNVYEINIPKPNLRKTPLGQRFKRSPNDVVRIMGPV